MSTNHKHRDPQPVFIQEPGKSRHGKPVSLKLQEYAAMVIILTGIVLWLWLGNP